ncbi:MAG: hypothetical protein GTO13_07540 [Proteobacteria bacterium]|nr:hypothetical protein [Pseudomonadota bacterium]
MDVGRPTRIARGKVALKPVLAGLIREDRGAMIIIVLPIRTGKPKLDPGSLDR